MAFTGDSKAPLRTVKRVQFGILSPDEIVSKFAVLVQCFVSTIFRIFVLSVNDCVYTLSLCKTV